MIKLGVNVDHVATLRQARGGSFPSPVQAAEAARRGGADSITVHLREDRRHIQESDVFEIKESVDLPLNLEMAATGEMVKVALRVRPEKVCLVPENRKELTTEGGLDVLAHEKRLRPVVKKLGEAGIEVSLFVDPDIEQIRKAKAVGAPFVELHTGIFANLPDRRKSIGVQELAKAARLADEIELRVNAGHGLNYQNTSLILAIPHIQELNIGHAIIAEALMVGMEAAVRRMKEIIEAGAFVR